MKHNYVNYRPPQYPDQVWNTREDGSLDIGHVNNKPSLTQQQFKDECDINNIMKSYQETGTISHLNPKAHLFGDFSDIKDFRESMELITYAQQEFDQLPAKVRSRFNNDPAELVEFCNHASNLEEAISLGLATKPAAQPINDDDSTTTINQAPATKVPKTKTSSKTEPAE